MLTLLTQSISNTSFGIFFPKFNGSLYEILAAPISTFEMVLAFVGAGATKTLIIGTVILATSNFFVDGSDEGSHFEYFKIISSSFSPIPNNK